MIEKLIKIKVDNTNAKKEVGELDVLIEKLDDVVKINIDNSEALTDIEKLDAQIKALDDADITLSVDTEQASTQIRVIEKQMTDLTTKLKADIQASVDASVATEGGRGVDPLASVAGRTGTNTQAIKATTKSYKELLVEMDKVGKSVISGRISFEKLTDAEIEYNAKSKVVIDRLNRLNAELSETNESLGINKAQIDSNNKKIAELNAGLKTGAIRYESLTKAVNKNNTSTGKSNINLNKLNKTTDNTTKALNESGGAMGILNQVTGGYAQVVKDLWEGTKDLTKGLSKMKIALIATATGAVVLAITWLIENWETVETWVSESAEALADYNNQMKKLAGTKSVSDAHLDYLQKQLTLYDKIGISTTTIKENIKAIYQMQLAGAINELNKLNKTINKIEEASTFKTTPQEGTVGSVINWMAEGILGWYKMSEQEQTDSLNKMKTSRFKLKAEIEALKLVLAGANDKPSSDGSGCPDCNKGEKEANNEAINIKSFADQLRAVDLVDIENHEVKVFQLKSKGAKETADMLENHAERVKEMDKQVLLNKVALASEYAASGAMLANAVEGFYDQEIQALEAKGITEGAEYEKAVERKEKAAIAGVIMDTGSAIMSTWASYMSSPGGVPGAILAGIQTAGLLVTALTQIKTIKNAESGTIGSGGGAPPVYNVIAENAYNPITAQLGNIADNTSIDKPTRAYVVSKDISTQQALDRQIESGASI